jgi:hypothetical protein
MPDATIIIGGTIAAIGLAYALAKELFFNYITSNEAAIELSSRKSISENLADLPSPTPENFDERSEAFLLELLSFAALTNLISGSKWLMERVFVAVSACCVIISFSSLLVPDWPVQTYVGYIIVGLLIDFYVVAELAKTKTKLESINKGTPIRNVLNDEISKLKKRNQR